MAGIVRSRLGRAPIAADALGVVYGRMAAEYEAQALASPLMQRAEARLFAHVCQRLDSRARLVEVGTGPGLLAIRLARRGVQVVAADISTGMLEHVARRAAEAGVSVPVLWLDASRPLTGIGPFDALVSMNGPLTFQADGVAAARRLLELVRPGGQVWLALPRAASLEQMARAPLRALLPALRPQGPHVETGLLKGQSIDVAIWDPAHFARAMAPWLAVEELCAAGVTLRGPAALDVRLGLLPGLRRLGAMSIVYGRRR